MTNKERLRRAARIRQFILKYYQKEGPKRLHARLQKAGINISIGSLSNTASNLNVKHRDPEVTEKIRKAIRQYYKDEGPEGVCERLKKENINITLEYIKNTASSHKIGYRDPQKIEVVKETVLEKYSQLGARGTKEYLKEKHGIAISISRIMSLASEFRMKINRTKKEEKPPEWPKRRWPEPEIIPIPSDKWNREGQRVAYLSYGPYRQEGWRAGLYKLAAQIAAQEGCHFPVLAGGSVSKEWIQAEIKRRLIDVKTKFTPNALKHVTEEVVTALASTLPKFTKPDGILARWYIMASLPFDGPHGEKILRSLQERRNEDVRQYKTGGERIEIQQSNSNPPLYHGVVLPKRSRLPSKYMSATVERDILDIEAQTSREYPNLWVHGTSATALYKPAGERIVPYISIPALHKLEAETKKIVENQVGFTIVEERPDGDRLVHFWNFRDFVAKEREGITGIKEGATEFHRKIIEIIKREGARHPGRLVDELGIDRETLEKEIKFLVEPKRSSRLTWPGLQYDESSQRYDFHTDWLEEKLYYSLPKDKDGWQEDSFLFFGCLHAGYRTTDYEFVVEEFPKIILKYDIKVLGGIGDFIAGLKHSFMHAGEIFQMNNTDQEQFAAELIDTIVFRVFVERMEKKLKSSEGRTITPQELKSSVEACLLLFLYIKGNHDEWQEREGNTPLQTFTDTLKSLLINHLLIFLANKGLLLPYADLKDMVERMVVLLDNDKDRDKPVYILPSGVKVGLVHPSMARADTTSLRAEKALQKFAQKEGCQVVGIANFHTAIFVHHWFPNVGQAVAAQTGTMVISTSFEDSKLKAVDFGPLYVRTLSFKGRIYTTTLAYFNKSRLTRPLPKDTNVTELKQKLGLLGYKTETSSQNQ